VPHQTSVPKTIRKPPLVKAQTATIKNKIRRKTIFNMPDGILTPCNVARGTGIMTLNSPGGSWPTLQSDTWLWDDMSLNSLGGNTLQCVMWLWNHDSEFTKWLHPAMWQVALAMA